MNTYQLLIDLKDGQGYVDYTTRLLRDMRINYQLGKQGKHAISEATIKLRPADDIIAILLAQTTRQGDVRIIRDGVEIFRGVIRPTLKLKAADCFLDAITLEVMSLEYKLKECLIGDGFGVKLGYKVCDPANPSNSLIHILLSQAGISYGTLPEINYTLDCYKPNPTAIIYDEIDKLTLSYGYGFLVSTTGVFYLYDYANTTTDVTLTEATIYESLQLSEGDNKATGLNAKYKKMETLPNAILWSLGEGQTLAPGENTPDPNDLQKYIAPNDECIIVYCDRLAVQAYPVTQSLINARKVVLATTQLNADGAKLSLTNNTATETLTLGDVKIKGRAYVTTECEAIVGEPNQSITLPYCYNEERAKLACATWCDVYKYGNVSFTFSADNQLAIGTIVLIQSSLMNVSVKVRVTSCSWAVADNRYQYQAEGVGSATSITDVETLKRNINASGFRDSNASRVLIQYALACGTTDADKPLDLSSVFVYGENFVRFNGNIFTIGSNWSEVQPQTNSQYPYIWCRIKNGDGDWVYSPWTGQQGKTFILTCVPVNFVINSRSTTNQILTLVPTISGYTNPAYTLTISAAAQSAGVAITGTALSIPRDIALSYFTVTMTLLADSSVTYSLTICGIESDSSAPQYFGTLPAGQTPVANFGEKFVVGDYYLSENTPYRWNGTAWVEAQQSDQNYSTIMKDSLYDVLRSDDVNEALHAKYGWFAKFIATEAFAELAYLVDATVENVMKSKNYNGTDEELPTLGWKLDGRNNRITTVEMLAIKAIIRGSLDATDSRGTILKTQFGATGATKTAGSPSRWKLGDAFNAVSAGDTGTLTYDGTQYSFKRTNSANPLNLITYSGNSNGASYTVGYGGKYRVIAPAADMGITVTVSHNLSILVDGVTVFDHPATASPFNIELTLNAGQVISIIDSGSEFDISIRFISPALTCYTGSQVVRTFGDSNAAVSKSCTIVKAGTTVFNSANDIHLAPITGWVTGLNQQTYSCSSASIVVINGVTYTVNSIDLTDSVLRLYTTSGNSFELSTAFSTAEGATTGWHYISGSLYLETEERGVKANTILPAESTSTIGKGSAKFFGGHFSNINVDNITIGGGSVSLGGILYGQINDTNSRMVYEVWGAVAN